MCAETIKHGTLYAYQGRSCRCADCREAAVEYARQRRKRKKAAQIEHPAA